VKPLQQILIGSGSRENSGPSTPAAPGCTCISALGESGKRLKKVIGGRKVLTINEQFKVYTEVCLNRYQCISKHRQTAVKPVENG
jgi:hypothetical protein